MVLIYLRLVHYNKSLLDSMNTEHKLKFNQVSLRYKRNIIFLLCSVIYLNRNLNMTGTF